MKSRTFSAEDILAVEQELYAGPFPEWANVHVEREGSGVDVFLGYNPELYPEQRLSESLTRARLSGSIPEEWIRKMPEALFARVIQYKLGKTLGSWAVAGAMIDDFRQVSHQTKEFIEDGQNVLFASAHADLTDFGKGMAALGAAMGNPNYIYDDFYAVLNKLLACEGVETKDGEIKTFTGLLRNTANIVWAIPNTGNARETYGISRKAFYIANTGAKMVLDRVWDDPEHGNVVAAAPQAAGMIYRRDEQGQLVGLDFPTTAESPENTMAKIDAALPFAYWKDPETDAISWEVGDYVTRDSIDADGKKPVDVNREFLDRVMRANQAAMRRLTGLPIGYEPLSQAA